MDDWEARYWRLHYVVGEISKALAVGIGGIAAYFVHKWTLDWGAWPSGISATVAFFAGFLLIMRELDLDR